MFDRGKTPSFFEDMDLAAVPEDYHENHDLNYVKALITELQRKYNIDEGRIFMQGMSAGNLMTAQFCRYYGNILAGSGWFRRAYSTRYAVHRQRRDQKYRRPSACVAGPS